MCMGVLHGGLIAEHHLQFLAVEFAPVGEVHDALPVVGELVDVHLLQSMGGSRVGIPFIPGEYPQADITLPPAAVQLPMRMQDQHLEQHLLVPWSMDTENAAGRGEKELRGSGGGT